MSFDYDPFGDTSFLADFDLEAAVKKRSNPTTAEATTKRNKVATSPRRPQFTIKTKADPNDHKNIPDPFALPEVKSSEDAPSPAPLLKTALEKTLQNYFGYPSFRQGQLEVIHSLLEMRDAAVFWATGTGKSLCYQVPALHTHHICIVVSPLISLMQDQVHKLNGLCDTKLATFLGTGQSEMDEEANALNGDYPLVYVTPEKLLSSSFLDELAALHRNKKRLGLFAVDEAHCVSEWGHDFRPEYRKLHLIRAHPVLREVPILTLTATAIPRVQGDIMANLRLHNPYFAKQSFDRDNLHITVQKKMRGGMRATFEPMIPQLNTNSSTIIYAATRDQVTEIASYLQTKLTVNVQPYHAGMSNTKRSEAHTNFLVGKTHVIVATVAFGMGIDKPDTRRVLHYGPPKTMEEYYQQIGRAGRDGRVAECCMWVNEADFDRYRSGFYTEKMSGEAERSFGESLDALRAYAFDFQACRRRSLLEYFSEEPDYDRCGTCDTCRNQQAYGGDSERDLGEMGARIVLKAADALDGQGMSTLEKVISGKILESYRYRRGVSPQSVQRFIESARSAMPKKRPLGYFRELLTPLVSKGFLSQQSKSAKIGRYTRSWTTYVLTEKGLRALLDKSVPIVLPVPQSMRQIEKEEEEKRQKVLEKLAKLGVKLEHIPKEEAEKGDGEVIQAFSRWNNYLESLENSNRGDRVMQLRKLQACIEEWRAATAAKQLMAPAAVLGEHMVASLAYMVASLAPGVKVERDSLLAAGVRSRELDSLVSALHNWTKENQPRVANDSKLAQAMVLPDGLFTPSKPWEYAVYKPNKKTNVAAWESSYDRFLAGEHPQTIAMKPANGRAIQVGTVIGHILEGLNHGRPVPLKRLAGVLPPPNKQEWDELAMVEASRKMSVVGNPITSGKNGAKFTKTEFLRPIMGDTFVDTPYNERNREDVAKFSRWCQLVDWFSALRRAGIEPTFR